MLTIPIREIVAGDACMSSCVSKIKLTLSPNRIRHPDGNVSNLLQWLYMKCYNVILSIEMNLFWTEQLTYCHPIRNLRPEIQQYEKRISISTSLFLLLYIVLSFLSSLYILQSNWDQFHRRILSMNEHLCNEWEKKHIVKWNLYFKEKYTYSR